MRIALFTETYLPHINGVVTHVKLLKDGLEKLGHTVLIVTADSNIFRHKIEDGVLFCPAKRMRKFYSYGVAPPMSPSRQKYIKRFNPDIIHIHQEFGIGISGMRAAQELKKPLVYTLHTMYDEYLYYIVPKRFLSAGKILAHRYFKYLGEAADALTGPSKKCEEYFRLVGVDKEVNVVPNAVELDMFNQENISDDEKVEFRKKYKIPKNATLACFVGRLGAEKSVDVLLSFWAESMASKKDVHLVIIGDGPAKRTLMKQAAVLGISDKVTFTGAIQHNDLPPYLGSCDIYVTASLSDTNSISMLEGMATGLPVLQLTDKLNEDQVINGENGFVFNTPQEMAHWIEHIINMPHDELSALRKKVATSVLESGATTLANNMLKVYEKAAEQKKLL